MPDSQGTPARPGGGDPESAEPGGGDWVDAEFKGEHGRTALPGTLQDEEHPEINPQTPGGALRKVKEEAAEGESVVDKAKRVVEEADRQISGEYERREDPAVSD